MEMEKTSFAQINHFRLKLCAEKISLLTFFFKVQTSLFFLGTVIKFL